MKTSKLIVLAMMAGTLAACSTSKENSTTESDEATFVSTPYTGSIAGEWKLADIEMYDTLSLKPSEISPEEPQLVLFTDSTYHFQTNCNMVQGDYTQSGDTISFGMGMSTRMACPDMRVEDALNQLLPQLTAIGMDNDSTLRIYARNPSAYIILNKIK